MHISKLNYIVYYFLLFIILSSVSSCKTPANVEYDLIIDVHEFEIKHSHDLFDRKPETYIQTETEAEIKISEIYNEYKVNFVDDAKTYRVKLKGISFSDDYVFSVSLYDYDLFSSEDDYIGGVEMKIRKNTGILSETVTVDNNDFFMIFTYSIENLKFNQ
jgi:hypothetical protein